MRRIPVTWGYDDPDFLVSLEKVAISGGEGTGISAALARNGRCKIVECRVEGNAGSGIVLSGDGTAIMVSRIVRNGGYGIESQGRAIVELLQCTLDDNARGPVKKAMLTQIGR